jgi:tRNA threonylcarbamoyladenosine biosynthesis protein TsaE
MSCKFSVGKYKFFVDLICLSAFAEVELPDAQVFGSRVRHYYIIDKHFMGSKNRDMGSVFVHAQSQNRLEYPYPYFVWSDMPILDPYAIEFTSRSPDQTRRVGMRLGGLLQPGDTLALYGDLGAGKTTFVQGIAQGWGSLDAVTSPTFVLCNQYRRPDGMLLHHLDAYRMTGALEAEDLDIIAMLESGPLLVEWAERIEAALPAERLLIKMNWVADEQRGMLLTPRGERYRKLLVEFRKHMFGGS